MNKTIRLSLTAVLLAANSLSANQDLGSITVTSAAKSKQSIKEVTSNIEVITGAELQEKHITSVAGALNLINGINFTTKGGIGSTTSVMLRGMDNKRVLVLIDGINYKDPSSTSGTSFAHLMVNDIERIEVVKGAQSSIWGNDATAGVINIITKEAKAGYHTSVVVEKGSFNTRKAHVATSYKNDGFDIKVSANRLLSDNFTSQAPKGDDIKKYEDDPYQNTTINLTTNYNYTHNDKVGFSITDINALTNYDSWNNPDAVQRSDVNNRLYSVYYDKALQNHNIKLKYNNSDFNRDELDTVISNYVKKFDSNLQTYELTDSINYSKNSDLLIGTSYEKYDVSYERVDNNNSAKKVDIKSLFITNIYKKDNYIVNPSVRVDDFSTIGKEYTGKLGFKYLINSDTDFSINYGTAFNAPNIMELLNPWGATANTVVTPEKTKSFDISFGYRSLNITYFYNQVKDLIEWYDPNPYNSWAIKDGMYINRSGTSKFKGYEISYSTDITEDTLLTMNYNRLSAKNSDGEFLAKRPKETLKFGVDYYGIAKLHLGLNGEYIGKRYDKDGETGAQTGRYTVGNFVANYDMDKNVQLYCKIDNITNKYYQVSDGYATSPRAYYAGLKYNF